MYFFRYRYFLILFFFFVFSVPPCASSADENVDAGQITFRAQVADLDYEKIDPYTGHLSLTYKDIELPGNGGLDLEIYRTYQVNRKINYTVLGLDGICTSGV